MAAKIARREWRPAEPIATEQELAKTYAIAVGTVRKAVDLLVAEGLLERFQGRGTFVKRASFDGSLFRFFRFQNSAGERQIPVSRILRREVVAAPHAVAEPLSLREGAKAIHMSRLRSIDGMPILAEEIWLPYDKFKSFLAVETGEIGDLLYPEYETHCGQVVASASETLTVETVDRTCARLLGLKSGTPVVLIERLAYSYDRQPLEWRRSRGPATHFRYHVEIR